MEDEKFWIAFDIMEKKDDSYSPLFFFYIPSCGFKNILYDKIIILEKKQETL